MSVQRRAGYRQLVEHIKDVTAHSYTFTEELNMCENEQFQTATPASVSDILIIFSASALPVRGRNR